MRKWLQWNVSACARIEGGQLGTGIAFVDYQSQYVYHSIAAHLKHLFKVLCRKQHNIVSLPQIQSKWPRLISTEARFETSTISTTTR